MLDAGLLGQYGASGPVATLTLVVAVFDLCGISSRSGYRCPSPVGSWLTETEMNILPNAPAGSRAVENSGGGGNTAMGRMPPTVD